MTEPDLILALDPGEYTGWALLGFDGSLMDWGRFRCAKTKSLTMWVRFRRQLSLIASGETLDRIEAVVHERPFSSGKRPAGRVLWGLSAHAEDWATKRGIEYAKPIPPTQVKRLATGSGNAEKPAVCKACAIRFPGRGFEGLVEAGTGPWDGSDATAVGLAYLELRRRGDR